LFLFFGFDLFGLGFLSFSFGFGFGFGFYALPF
jgi:hypothetical protein